MSLSQEPDPPQPQAAEDQALRPHRIDWLTVGQFAFSTVGAFLMLGISLVGILVMLLRDGLSGFGSPPSLDLSPYLFGAGVGFAGLLMVPSAYFSGRKLLGGSPPPTLFWTGWVRISYLFPLLIGLGYALQVGPDRGRLLLPAVHVLANGLAILWLLSLARRGLPGESASRTSGSLVSGLALTPLITFTLEMVLLVGIGLVWVVALGRQPDFSQELMDLAARWGRSPANPQLLEQTVGQFAAQPVVIGTLLTYMSLLVPAVEELFKPAAVWLLVRARLQPWEGFAVGAVAGAGYALFENLSVGSSAEVWTFVMVSRIGTSAMHVLTAGLVGWGLASAFTQKQYGRLAAAYAAAVLLHGVWNGINMVSVLGGFPSVRTALGTFGSNLAHFAPVGLVVLGLGSLIGLIKANKTFRRAIMAQEKIPSEAEWKSFNS